MTARSRGLEPPHLLGREVWVERRPVLRVLRRVEVQRRPPTRDGSFGTTFWTVAVNVAGSCTAATTSSYRVSAQKPL